MAHGNARSHGTSQMDPPVTSEACGAPIGIAADASPIVELDALESGEIDAVRVHDVARRVRARDDRATELLDLLDREDGNGAGAGYDTGLAVEFVALGGQHALGEVDHAVSGRLSAHERAAPVGALPSEDSRFVAVRDPLVLAEQVADLPRSDPDVTGRNVGVLADMAVELGHEALAEPHDFVVAAPLGFEVGAALAAANGHAGECVLERLLETEELHDPGVDRRVEPQSTFVGTECAVELDPEASVDLDLSAVVDPRDPKDDLSFGFTDPFDGLVVGEFGVLGQHWADGDQHIADGLKELDLAGVAPSNLRMNTGQLLVDHGFSVLCAWSLH